MLAQAANVDAGRRSKASSGTPAQTGARMPDRNNIPYDA